MRFRSMIRKVRRHRFGAIGAAGKAASSLLGRAVRKPKRWIQKTIRRPGALRADVHRRYGKRGFDTKGRIRPEVLTKLSHEPGKVGARARLAKRLRGMKHGGKR